MGIKTVSKILLLTMILICLFNSTIYAGEELLKTGDSSDDVALLQQLLKDRGYFEYEYITGYYGKITEDAVKTFQKANGLKIDGVTGTATWAALLSLASEADVVYGESTESVTNSNEEMAYSIGMECADIALIQSRLIDLGFYNYSHITGYFGSITQKAVRSFQKSCALEASGIVYEATWDKLFDDYVAGSLLPGTISDAVIVLQTRLFELGYYAFIIDGNFGPKTKEAVIYFQKISQLTANGIANAQTQELLFSDYAIGEQEARRNITSKSDVSVIINNPKPRAEDIVELAKQYLGYPYVYGAQGPDSFDCEGFIAYIYDLVGVSMPESEFIQNYDNYGIKINNRLDLKLGDLVFFDTVFTDGYLADHVGIYIGDGSFIHVAESFGERAVVIDSMTKDYGFYTARFVWGRRIIE